MARLHLDSEYRDRWEIFHLSDGTVEDSRQKNWREVAWDMVIEIEVHMLGNTYKVDNSGSGFRAFMNFRWGGYGCMLDEHNKPMKREPINIWTVGWTDGEECFLKDIDAATGKFIKNYKTPLFYFKAHLHPAIKQKVLGGFGR